MKPDFIFGHSRRQSLKRKLAKQKAAVGLSVSICYCDEISSFDHARPSQ
jgi:hypothetical protein